MPGVSAAGLGAESVDAGLESDGEFDAVVEEPEDSGLESACLDVSLEEPELRLLAPVFFAVASVLGVSVLAGSVFFSVSGGFTVESGVLSATVGGGSTAGADA